MAESGDAGLDAEMVARYERGVELVERALSQLSEEDLDRASGEGMWTARMVVHHLADSEARSYVRLRQLLADEEPVEIQAYDEARWAETPSLGYRTEPIEGSLDIFRAVRSASARLLRRVRHDELDRRGVHTESGAYTLRDWLSIYAAHAEQHARQIEEAAGR